jgi:glycosyltransferase involved in cell wall biosynthesis
MSRPSQSQGAEGERVRRRFTIALCPGATAYDYELAKLPHNFVLLGNTHERWDHAVRPMPDTLRTAYRLADVSADLLILSIDQWTYDEVDRRLLFVGLRDRFPGPTIVVNHGCNMIDGCSSEIMRDLVGDSIMVARSETAAELWNLRRSHVVRPGLAPDEWPHTDYSRGNVVVLQPWDHAEYYNAGATTEIVKRIDKKVNFLGRGRPAANFDMHRSLLTTSSVFFNPSYAAPAPQAMLEAQLCGLAIVTTDRHGESSYIVNGENGFASNDMNELFSHVKFLLAHPNEAARIGANGRQTAQRVFSSVRFLAEWDSLIAETMDGVGLDGRAGNALG